MKIAVVCVTYNRPRQLGQMIRCFQRQDYAPRELVILDDAGQYAPTEGPGWRLTSVAERFPTLGEKRNAAARLVSPDAEALAVWDDDDLYMPWALRASAAALEHAAWSRPAWCCTHSPTARCNSTGPADSFTPAGPTAAMRSSVPADTRTSTTAKIRGWPSDSAGWESPSPILGTRISAVSGVLLGGRHALVVGRTAGIRPLGPIGGPARHRRARRSAAAIGGSEHFTRCPRTDVLRWMFV